MLPIEKIAADITPYAAITPLILFTIGRPATLCWYYIEMLTMRLATPAALLATLRDDYVITDIILRAPLGAIRWARRRHSC